MTCFSIKSGVLLLAYSVQASDELEDPDQGRICVSKKGSLSCPSELCHGGLRALVSMGHSLDLNEVGPSLQRLCQVQWTSWGKCQKPSAAF